MEVALRAGSKGNLPGAARGPGQMSSSPGRSTLFPFHQVEKEGRASVALALLAPCVPPIGLPIRGAYSAASEERSIADAPGRLSVPSHFFRHFCGGSNKGLHRILHINVGALPFHSIPAPFSSLLFSFYCGRGGRGRLGALSRIDSGYGVNERACVTSQRSSWRLLCGSSGLAGRK